MEKKNEEYKRNHYHIKDKDAINKFIELLEPYSKKI